MTSPTIILVAVAAVAVSGCSLSVDIDDDAKRRVETDSVPAGELTALDIATGNGAIDVTAAAVDDITIRSIFRESDVGDADSTIEVDGNRLVVRGECDAGWFDSCQVGFEVTVPTGFDVSVETDNGSVVVDGIAGSVDLESNNGAVSGRRLSSPDARAQTDNGRVELSFDTAPLMVEAITDNGGIDIAVPVDGLSYDVDAETDNGRIDVDVPIDGGSDHRIIATTDNGGIDVLPTRS